MCVKTSGSKCFHCAKCVHGVSCLRSWITHDYAVAKDYQCIGANQWSISGPSVVQALQRFWASTARDSSKEAQLRRCEGVFGTSKSSCWTQVFVVACVSAHLEIYICMPRICIHTYVHITAIKSNMAVMNQRQHPSPCHQGSGFSCLIHTTTLCEAACEKRLAEWKRDHARNPMDHRSSRVRRITTTSKGAVAPFVVKAAVHHCHRKLSFALRGMTEISGSFVMTLRGTSKRQVIVASRSLLTLVLARLRY